MAITVVKCNHLLDIEAGTVEGPTAIVVEDGRIKDLVRGAYSGSLEGSTEIRLPDADTCLPGLIDCHVHLTTQFEKTSYSDKFRLNATHYAILGTISARRTLMAGFTTVRNLGDYFHEQNVSLALRDAINAGRVVGPRVYAVGKFIGSTGGHADATNGFRADLQGDPGPLDGIVNSVADAWKAVRQHYKDGVDVIKIMPSGGVLDESASSENPQMTLDEIRAVVEAARDYGFTVAAHAHGAEAIRRAVIGGVDSIEHGTFMDDADIDLMKQHGTYYVPTIIAGQWVGEKARNGWYPQAVARKALEIGPRMRQTAAKAYKAGIKIAFGTDGGVYPHGVNAREFAYMVDAGIAPLDAIRAATVTAAQLLKHEGDFGSISVGKVADIIAVRGDPLSDVGALQSIDFVMKAGAVYKSNGQPTAAALESSLPRG